MACGLRPAEPARALLRCDAMGVHLRIAGRTDVGRVRPKNEDAFLAVDLTGGQASVAPRWTGHLQVVGDRGVLIAVSDGMGGASEGEVASSLVVSSLAQALASSTHGMPSQERITGAVEDAHHTVWAEACNRGIRMGATLTAVYVRRTAAYVAEVGDSRAYLIRAGQMTRLTKDQSYVQTLVDSGIVDPEQAPVHPMRNIILQAMGHQPKVSVALGRLELRRHDCLLLCSDGLSTELTDEEMGALVLGSPDLMLAADRLVDAAIERGGRDNATVVLAGVGGELPAPISSEPFEKTYRVLETFDA
jgi:serine/threonine protein phosphatase PrpC